MEKYYRGILFLVSRLRFSRPKAAFVITWKLLRWNLAFVISHLLPLRKQRLWLQVISPFGFDKTGKYVRTIQKFFVPKIPKRGDVYFYLDELLVPNSQFKRVGFVFFMGIGDYFYATNFLEIFHRKYSHIKLDAYVSRNTDINNSPLVGKCLEKNPLFENIYYFDGKPCPSEWKNYDYTECYKLKSADTLLLPMIYLHDPSVSSRTEGLCDVFRLPRPSINPTPIIYDYTPSEQVISVFERYRPRMKKVLFIQMSSRSSAYVYPYADELIKKALHAGYFVITPEKTEIVDDNLYVIDIKSFVITDTISLLKLIKEQGIPVYICEVISCFAAISAGLNIPNLILQHYWDFNIRAVYYSNMFIVTPRPYMAVPADRQFIYSAERYDDVSKVFFNYQADFVWDCFLKMTELWDKNSGELGS